MFGIGCGGDLHRAEQPGFDQCPARFFNLALVINLAAPPAHTPLDIGRIEPFEPRDHNRTETHDRSRVERVSHVHRLCAAVDLDTAVSHFSKRMTAVAERCH